MAQENDNKSTSPAKIYKLLDKPTTSTRKSKMRTETTSTKSNVLKNENYKIYSTPSTESTAPTAKSTKSEEGSRVPPPLTTEPGASRTRTLQGEGSTRSTEDKNISQGHIPQEKFRKILQHFEILFWNNLIGWKTATFGRQANQRRGTKK